MELKSKYPDVLLMVEVGYKYRFFGEDAEVAARTLGIYAHMDHNFMTASIPTFRLHVHVRRLVSAGYKVGVVKQTETAAIKSHGSNRLGPFCRGLSALYTKATLEAAEDLGGGEEGCGTESNYLLCVVEKSILGENSKYGLESGFDVKIGIIGMEISTGDVVYGEFNDNYLRSALEAAMLNLSPAELLLGDPLSKQTEKVVSIYKGIGCLRRDNFFFPLVLRIMTLFSYVIEITSQPKLPHCLYIILFMDRIILNLKSRLQGDLFLDCFQ